MLSQHKTHRQHEEDKRRHPQHQDLLVAFALGVKLLVIRTDEEGPEQRAQQQHHGQGGHHLGQELQDPQASEQQARVHRGNKRFLKNTVHVYF